MYIYTYIYMYKHTARYTAQYKYYFRFRHVHKTHCMKECIRCTR